MNKYRRQLIIDYLGLEPEFIEECKQMADDLINTAYQIENDNRYKNCSYCLKFDSHLYRDKKVIDEIKGIVIYK